ncbi:hypothetical protein Q4506_17210 [Colwellia sp. 4_MG-2023]|uniref:hypothetical protein n=1 Tax=unclassified Colwellia TaxID=196834 RepID=UPI0026E43AB0|nr:MULTISPECIES: hypothetical protein [unclassified Colwellia]MDO6508751.1 hypothetical protein [Colwellia sp. 5_MG-2023]MDO6557416.1 hypothetical protein [Colwellia sp. 4_MG-2023]
MNEVILKLNSLIERFEYKNNVILFDEKRINTMSQEQQKVIYYLNYSVDPFNLHPMQILNDVMPQLELLDDENVEKQFFYSLIENIINIYSIDRASNVSVSP